MLDMMTADSLRSTVNRLQNDLYSKLCFWAKFWMATCGFWVLSFKSLFSLYLFFPTLLAFWGNQLSYMKTVLLLGVFISSCGVTSVSNCSQVWKLQTQIWWNSLSKNISGGVNSSYCGVVINWEGMPETFSECWKCLKSWSGSGLMGVSR